VRLQRALEFKGLALADAAGLLVQGVAAVAIAVIVRGPGALVAADLLGGLTTGAWIVGRLSAPIIRTASAAENRPFTARSVLREASPFSGFALVTAGRDLATNVFVGALVGVRALGLLQFAYRVLTPVLVIFTAVGQLAIPLGRAVFAGSERAREQVRDGFLLSGLLAALVLGAVAASAHWLVPLAFGSRWSDAVPLVVAVALALVISGPLNYLGLGLLVSAGRVAIASAIVIGSAAVFAGAVTLLPISGARVGAAAWLVMAVVEAVAVAAACHRLLGLHLGRASLLPPLVFAVAYGVGVALGDLVQSDAPFATLLLPSLAASVGAAGAAAGLSYAFARQQVHDLASAVRRPARPVLAEAAA
jgi:O-antigen/teichoic acid export membrane protein